MNLRTLETFVAVAKYLNVTHAAAQIHRAQSSVSEQIQSLEADFGVALFDRSGRKLSLTSAGVCLLEYALEMLALADEARGAVKDAVGLVDGSLSVGGLETLCAKRLVAPVAKFCRQFPKAEVRLESSGSENLRNEVKSGRLDVGFMFGPAPDDPELDGEALTAEPLVIIVPTNHRFAGSDALTAAEFADEPFLVTEVGCVYRRMFDEVFPASAKVRPSIVGEFSSIAAIRGMVEVGHGCALVPRVAVADAVADGKVGACSWNDGVVSTPLSVIWRRRRIQARILREFLATTRENLRD
ncbi:MAG: LysR family transcriptional regulator [Acidihalobacter sp.]|uniref:LysR family transcriptional regulator n=1 Tax=Acidihalobacter sp. TaxID=1872108 RepID=UPI00307F9E63